MSYIWHVNPKDTWLHIWDRKRTRIVVNGFYVNTHIGPSSRGDYSVPIPFEDSSEQLASTKPGQLAINIAAAVRTLPTSNSSYGTVQMPQLLKTTIYDNFGAQDYWTPEGETGLADKAAQATKDRNKA